MILYDVLFIVGGTLENTTFAPQILHEAPQSRIIASSGERQSAWNAPGSLTPIGICTPTEEHLPSSQDASQLRLAKLQAAGSSGDEQRRPALAIQGVDRAASIQQDAQDMRQFLLACKMDWHALQPIRCFHVRTWMR